MEVDLGVKACCRGPLGRALAVGGARMRPLLNVLAPSVHVRYQRTWWEGRRRAHSGLCNHLCT